MKAINDNTAEQEFVVHNGSYDGIEAHCYTLVSPLNRDGIHARPAALIVHTAQQYDFDCFITPLFEKSIVSAKSIMSLMCLTAAQGTPLLIYIPKDKKRLSPSEGRECLERIVALFNRKFDED